MALVPAFALLLAACIEGAPKPLPERQSSTEVKVDSRMVRAGEVEGYLGRPKVEGPVQAELFLVDVIDEALRSQVQERARAGVGVLAVEAQVSEEAALTYLRGMPWTQEVKRLCLRQDGCLPDPSPQESP